MDQYFARFRTNGFVLNTASTFENEFDRLAKLMKWRPHERGYKRQLTKAKEAIKSAKELDDSPRLNTLAGYPPFPSRRHFDPAPSSDFDTEFDRLAKIAKLDTTTALRDKHYRRAKSLDQKLHAIADLSNVKFFEVYKKHDGFQLEPGAAMDLEFQRLAVFKGWGPLKFLARWRQLLAELVRFLPPASTASTVTTSALDTSAPSEISGVRLPVSISEYNTEHSEYTPAPSVISSYFSSFVDGGFTPDPTNTLEQDFERLSVSQGWQRHSSERVKQWQHAVESELEAQYGPKDKLTSWQALCSELGIEETPQSITQCKKALAKKHVSIKDVVEARRKKMQKDPEIRIMDVAIAIPTIFTVSAATSAGAVTKTTAEVFKSIHELRKHCRKTKGFFSKANAKEDGFLKALLRLLAR